MNITLSNALAFVAGAAVSAAVTWKLLKDYYAKLAEIEISEMREYYFEKTFGETEGNDSDALGDTESDEPEHHDIREYAAMLAKQGYTNYTDANDNKNKEVENVEKPYVIAPEEYGAIYSYDQVSLLYFADGVLTDEMYEPIEDVEGTVGEDSLKTFGDFEEDTVFVRNDRLKIDYEILFDSRNYNDDTNDLQPSKVEE